MRLRLRTVTASSSRGCSAAGACDAGCPSAAACVTNVGASGSAAYIGQLVHRLMPATRAAMGDSSNGECETWFVERRRRSTACLLLTENPLVDLLHEER